MGDDISKEAITMDIHGILQQLPHRYPFLMIDRVLECIPGKSIKAIKNVTMNEPFFTGHFPQRPVMPGVMMIEAMAQATGILAFKTVGATPDSNTLYVFAGIDKARFKRPVEPGDQLVIDATLVKQRRSIWKFEAKALVDGEIAASAELMCAPTSF